MLQGHVTLVQGAAAQHACQIDSPLTAVMPTPHPGNTRRTSSSHSPSPRALRKPRRRPLSTSWSSLASCAAVHSWCRRSRAAASLFRSRSLPIRSACANFGSREAMGRCYHDRKAPLQPTSWMPGPPAARVQVLPGSPCADWHSMRCQLAQHALPSAAGKLPPPWPAAHQVPSIIKAVVLVVADADACPLLVTATKCGRVVRMEIGRHCDCKGELAHQSGAERMHSSWYPSQWAMTISRVQEHPHV